MTEPSRPDSPTGVVRVALPVPLLQTFSYLSGSSMVRTGSRVRVPFGRAHRVGVVVETGTEADAAGQQLKTVDAVLDDEPLFDPELLSNLRRAADYWCRWGCAKAARLPISPRKPGD
jgi:primosomal protein N' (replication factor Y)